MEEIWKPIVGLEGYYEVSNLGRLKGIKFGTIYKLSKNRDGYLQTIIKFKGKKIHLYAHKQVAKSFIKNTLNKKTVNHIDGDKNNNKVSNLEWLSQGENLKHAYSVGLMGVKPKKGYKLNIEDVVFIRQCNLPVKKLSEKYNVTTKHIKAIRHFRKWKSVI